MQSVKKNVRNVREADSIKTLSDQSSHKCGYQHLVYPHVTIAYNESHVLYKVKQCSAIPPALQWVELTDISAAVEGGGAVTCAKQVRHKNSTYIVIGGRSPDNSGVVWVVSIKSGRLIRNCFSLDDPVSTVSCYSSSTLLSEDGIIIIIGTLHCHIYITYINPLTVPNAKPKHLLPTTFVDDICARTLGSSTYPCFEVGAAAHVRSRWHYMLPGTKSELKSSGTYPEARVSSVALFDVMGCVMVGYTMGGWQIWSVAGSKAVLIFTSEPQPKIYPPTNFSLLTPENDPHNMLYLWVTHSAPTLPARDPTLSARDPAQTSRDPAQTARLTTATMYQLQFKTKVAGSNPGVNDQYRKLVGLVESFHFNLDTPLFVGKESGLFLRLVDFEAIQKINFLQGCNDFNGIVMTLDTSKFLITVLFDLNAWYFAQMPSLPNQIARLSPYISYLPLEKSSIPPYCCLQAVKVKAQSLFRGKQSSSEACNIFPCSLNTIVRYHIGKNIINAFYFPTNELMEESGNTLQGLVSLALKGIFTKHNTLVHSKKGKQKLAEFLLSFLPELKAALNDAMAPMLGGLPTGNGEIKKLRHLLSVTSHCEYLVNKLKSSQKLDQDGHLVLYRHTHYYAKTVLALTDMGVLPSLHDSLQDNGCKTLPLRAAAVGEIMGNIAGLSDLWDNSLYPPRTIRSLLNVFYTKPLDITLQAIVVSYSVLYLDRDDLDITKLNILPREDAEAIKSLHYLDQREYRSFIKHLPNKSGVFNYCNINNICEILLQHKQKEVAVQMLMLLDDSYSCQYSPKTMSLLTNMLPSEYRISLFANGTTDTTSFSSVLSEQLSHKQFISVLQTLDSQEKFDCLFFLILKKNKLCDLLSAYGEAQRAQKSSSQFLEFMFLYTIKHFSDIELKASITSHTHVEDDVFNRSIPLSAQKCQNDIAVLSKFCMKTDLGQLKIGRSPKVTKSKSDPRILKTPPPNVLDVSDDLLQQLRTPHPTPLKQRVLTALEAPRSCLRSSKTDRKNRKRIRFGDPDEPSSQPIRLSFGGLEFNEPSSSSPAKKQSVDENTFSHQGVSLADISPPKPFIESVVHYDEHEDAHVPLPMQHELSNDSISFEINPKSYSMGNKLGDSQFDFSPVVEDSAKFDFAPVMEESSSKADFNSLFGNNPPELDDAPIDISMDASFVSAESSKLESSVEEVPVSQLFLPDVAISPIKEVMVRHACTFKNPDPKEMISLSPDNSDSEDSSSSKEMSPKQAEVVELDDDDEEEDVDEEVEEDEAEEEEEITEITSDIEDITESVEELVEEVGNETDGSVKEAEEMEEMEEGEYVEEGIIKDLEEAAEEVAEGVETEEDEEVAASMGEAEELNGEDIEQGEEEDVEAGGDVEEVGEDGDRVEVRGDGEVSDHSAHSQHSDGSIQVIGIDSSHSDVESEDNGSSTSSGSESDHVSAEEAPVNDGERPQNDVESDEDAAHEDAAHSDGSIQVIGIDSSHSEVEAEDVNSSSDGSHSGDDAAVIDQERESSEESSDNEQPAVVGDQIEQVARVSDHSEERQSDASFEDSGSEGSEQSLLAIASNASDGATEGRERVDNDAVELSDEEDKSVDEISESGDGNAGEGDYCKEVAEDDNKGSGDEESGEDIVMLDEEIAHDDEAVNLEAVELSGEENSSSSVAQDEAKADRSVRFTEEDSVILEAAADMSDDSIQKDESFVSAVSEEMEGTTETGSEYCSLTSQVGAILEDDSDESEDEEFVFETPQEAAPHNQWFKETFPDHDTISFDFNIPSDAGVPTRRVTRSQKAKALGSKDVSPPHAVVPSTSFIPSVALLDPPPLEASSLSAPALSTFSPETPVPKNKTTLVSSPFTASLTDLIPPPSGPIYQLRKSGEGKFKIESIQISEPNLSLNISGDTESLDGAEFQSFNSVDETEESNSKHESHSSFDLVTSSPKSSEANCEEMEIVPTFSETSGWDSTSGLQSQPQTADAVSDDFMYIDRTCGSDRTESLGSPRSAQEANEQSTSSDHMEEVDIKDVQSEPQLLDLVESKELIPTSEPTETSEHCQPDSINISDPSSIESIEHVNSNASHENLSVQEDFTRVDLPESLESDVRETSEMPTRRTLRSRNRGQKSSAESSEEVTPSPKEDIGASPEDLASESVSNSPKSEANDGDGDKETLECAKVDDESSSSEDDQSEEVPKEETDEPREVPSRRPLRSRRARAHEQKPAEKFGVSKRSVKFSVDDEPDEIEDQDHRASDESKESYTEEHREMHNSPESSDKVSPPSRKTLRSRKAKEEANLQQNLLQNTPSKAKAKSKPSDMDVSPEAHPVRALRARKTPLKPETASSSLRTRGKPPIAPPPASPSRSVRNRRPPQATRTSKRGSADKSPPGEERENSSPENDASSPDDFSVGRATRSQKLSEEDGKSSKVANDEPKSARKGKLRPRKQTNSESNNEDKPANKIRKSDSDLKSEEDASTSSRPPIAVTRSTRRMRRQQQLSSTSPPLEKSNSPEDAPENVPLLSARSTRSGRKNVGPSVVGNIPDETPVRRTRRKNDTSETSKRPSKSEEQSPAKKQCTQEPTQEPVIVTRRTRNTPAPAPRVASSRNTPAPSPVISERRTTRSTRKASR